MNDFLEFVNNLKCWFPVHVEIGYNKTTDWCIRVIKKGCAEYYPKSAHDGEDAVLVHVQDPEIHYVFAKAQVELKEWMMINCGGY